MRHPKDSPLQDSSQSDRRRFFQILDELAGINGQGQDDALLEREMREAEPAPLSPDAIDRAVAELRRLRQAAAAHKPRRSWWRRPAAVIPIAAVLLLAASTPVYLDLVWSGRNSSKELAYEDALDIVFHEGYPVGSRESAQGRVGTSILRGFTAIKKCRGEPNALADEAERVLKALRAMVAEPGSVARGRHSNRGAYERLLATLSDPDRTVAERIQALDDFQEAIRAGIGVLNRAQQLGAPFQRNSRILFKHLARRLETKPAASNR